MRRLIIVSNRLPFSLSKQRGKIAITPSVGGLATGMKSIYKTYDSLWIGWPGIVQNRINRKEKTEITERMEQENCLPVFLSQQDINQYYSGFSNKTIWPLFHYFTHYVVYREDLWKAYIHVNKLFAKVISEQARPDDIIWIHDYHLLLLPKMIREAHPGVTIGFFLHIPFPSYEIFRLIPWRREILEGMLGSDLLGFHTYDYQRHFISSSRRLLGHQSTFNQINLSKRKVKIDAFPMGINYEKFHGEALRRRNLPANKKSKLQREIENYFSTGEDRKIIISIDRLDYSKGIPNRLKAFEHFLEKNPAFREKVIMIMVAVPSRTNVEHYQMLKEEVDQMVGYINGKYGTIRWVPIWYLYRSLPVERLIELYNAADIALVTPARDGMNLIAKEYIASKTGNKGVLILSEMAGSVRELGESIIVNPNNIKNMAEAIRQAMKMPVKEQRERIKLMQERIKRYNVEKWAKDFMESLIGMTEVQEKVMAKRLRPESKKKILEDFRKSKKRLIFLNYDGTLMPLRKMKVGDKPDQTVMDMVRSLSADPKNKLIIYSGRDRNFLDRYFGEYGVALLADYGIWMKENGKWKMTDTLTNEWKGQVRTLLQNYTDRTPGSKVHEKDYMLSWDYSRTDPDFGTLRVRELKDELRDLASSYNLQILEGYKVLEIRPFNIHKGRIALEQLEKDSWDFILGIGDDWTDENLFETLPEHAYSIRVGWEPSLAGFQLESYKDVRSLIRDMIRS